VSLARSRASGDPEPPLTEIQPSGTAVNPLAHTGPSSTKHQAEFEYKTIEVPRTGTTFTSHKRDRILNKYARQGWEVDQYATLPSSEGRTRWCFAARSSSTLRAGT
jgi:hypothetical protein